MGAVIALNRNNPDGLSANWLWIDKNSKKLGGLAMPWSYSVNLPLFYIHQYKKNEMGCSTHAHNYYMQVLSELGLVGILFLAIFYISLLYLYDAKNG